MFDADTLINSACSEFDLSQKEITKLRRQYDRKVDADLSAAASGITVKDKKRSVREMAVDGFQDLISIFRSPAKEAAPPEDESPELLQLEPDTDTQPVAPVSSESDQAVVVDEDVVSGMVPLSALVAERTRVSDLMRELDSLQETLQQAQQQKYMIVHQFEADLTREKEARLAAEATQKEAFETIGRNKHALEVSEDARRELQKQLDVMEAELQQLRGTS